MIALVGGQDCQGENRAPPDSQTSRRILYFRGGHGRAQPSADTTRVVGRACTQTLSVPLVELKVKTLGLVRPCSLLWHPVVSPAQLGLDQRSRTLIVVLTDTRDGSGAGRGYVSHVSPGRLTAHSGNRTVTGPTGGRSAWRFLASHMVHRTGLPHCQRGSHLSTGRHEKTTSCDGPGAVKQAHARTIGDLRYIMYRLSGRSDGVGFRLRAL